MKQLSIGEVGVIHGKTVLCVEEPMVYDRYKDDCYCLSCCSICAFGGVPVGSCPPCGAEHRIDKTDVFYPEITKGL